MARIEFTSLAEELTGKYAGSVFQDSYFGAQVRGWGKPRNPQTNLSQLRRGDFRFLVSSWRTLTTIEQNTWIAAAGSIPEGFRLFVGSNINLILIGEPLTSNFTTVSSPEEIDVSIIDLQQTSFVVQATGPTAIVPENCKLLLYATPAKQPQKMFDNPSSYQPFIYFDEGTDLSVPVDVIGNWIDKYGVLKNDMRVCIKSVVISKINGSRSNDFINCFISTLIMTLQQAYDASVAAGNFPQIIVQNADDSGVLAMQAKSNDESFGTVFILNTTQVSLNAGDNNAQVAASFQLFSDGSFVMQCKTGDGPEVQLLINADGSISFNSSTGAYSFMNLIDAIDDTAAQAAGVLTNGIYRNGSQLMICQL